MFDMMVRKSKNAFEVDKMFGGTTETGHPELVAFGLLGAALGIRGVF